jgi:PAS domain S-box-containing protein
MEPGYRFDMNVRRQSSSFAEVAMLCMSLLVVCAIAFLSYQNIQAGAEAHEANRISQGLANLSRQLLSKLKDAETGQRGFILTGKEEYLEPYHHAVIAIPQLLNQFKAQAIHARPDQFERILGVEPLVFQKLAELKETIQLRRDGKLAEIQAILGTGRGIQLMEKIRLYCSDIEEIAENRVAMFSAAEDKSAHHLRLVSIFGSALLFVFLLISAVVIFRSMARREELYRQVDAARKQLATTLEGIADAVIATDADGKVTFINPVARRLTGWDEPEAKGRHISEVFPIVNETTQAKVDNPLEKALSEGVAVGLANHTNLIARNGGQWPIDDSAAPLKDEHGELIGGVLVFRDISARRQSERKVHAAVAALGRSNEELQQFVNAAAHDLRSPLHTVKGMVQLLSRKLGDRLDGKSREIIGHINESVGRMSLLLEDLLSFAQASHFDNAAGPLPLDQALRAVLTNLHGEVTKAGAVVTSDPLPMIEAYETHMIQLLQNLIGNALKYRGPQPPRIHVSATHITEEWVISVSDNGIGIDTEYYEKIFQPFKRLHGDEYPGSGIGLATCQKIVAGYGGRIWVESVPGAGSKFFFSLPVGGSSDESRAHELSESSVDDTCG